MANELTAVQVTACCPTTLPGFYQQRPPMAAGLESKLHLTEQQDAGWGAGNTPEGAPWPLEHAVEWYARGIAGGERSCFPLRRSKSVDITFTCYPPPSWRPDTTQSEVTNWATQCRAIRVDLLAKYGP